MALTLAFGGVIFGFGLTVFFWWFTNHTLVPEIAWSDAVSKRIDPTNGQVAYRLKIKNVGRRDIVDLSCRATVFHPVISRMVPPVRTTLQIVNLPLKTERLFVLRAGKNRVLRLKPAECDVGYAEKGVAAKIRSGRNGSLEALLSVHPDCYMRLQILAYDSFSGARQFYESPKYTASDVVFGNFKGLAVPPADLTAYLTTEETRPRSPDE